ncbi:MAG: DUF502 domain-containing protein [Candidatus Omnitrophica bacterium]|nr:DUF502 domain-containing protein [Candidatus Omnitrophota bacterium]
MSKKIDSFRHRWSDHFVTGLFVLAPAYITYLIVKFFIRQIVRFFDPVVHLLDPYFTSVWAIVLVKSAALLIFVGFITLIGWGTHIFFVRNLFRAVDRWISRMPMVGKIYSAMREMSQAFSGEKKSAFSRVVLIEWPGKGRYAIGFVTHEGVGEVQQKTPEEVVNVFIPTTPNPTSGYLILVDRNAMIPLEMSVEDGMKLVISGGMVGPPVPSPQAVS